MIYLPASVRVYLCLTPCDMRKYVPSIVMWSRGERGSKSPGGRSLRQPGGLHIA